MQDVILDNIVKELAKKGWEYMTKHVYGEVDGAGAADEGTY